MYLSSLVTTTATMTKDLDARSCIDVLPSDQVMCTSSVPTQFPVDKGSGSETYSISLQAFASVGATTWETRTGAGATVQPQERGLPIPFYLYVFGLDRGPDNQELFVSNKRGLPRPAS